MEIDGKCGKRWKCQNWTWCKHYNGKGENIGKQWKTSERLELELCKVAIPRGTGRSYGIRWMLGMRVTDGTKVTDGQKDERTDGRMEG